MFAPGFDNSFKDEKVQGGEAGFKARLLDGRLMANAAAYYYVYDDMQVGANSFDERGTLAMRVLNAASSEIYGIEMDAAYVVDAVEGLTLRAALNWNEAEFDDFESGIATIMPPPFCGVTSTELTSADFGLMEAASTLEPPCARLTIRICSASISAV